MKNKFILTTLSILGFSGCAETTETPCMYGSPQFDYLYSGEVTDTLGNPIKGIQVTFDSQSSVTTDENGSFSAEFLDSYSYINSITFSDIDGEENGGEFASKEIQADDVDGVETDNGFSYTFDLGTVELEPKSEE